MLYLHYHVHKHSEAEAHVTLGPVSAMAGPASVPRDNEVSALRLEGNRRQELLKREKVTRVDPERNESEGQVRVSSGRAEPV